MSSVRGPIAVLMIGATIVAVSVAVMLWIDLGPGPLDVLIGAVARSTGVPLAIAVWGTIGALTLGAWALGRRPGIGTVAAPLIVGPVMQFTYELLDGHSAPDGFVIRLILHAAAVGGAGFGSALVVVSGLGAGTGELLTTAAADRVRRSEPRVRLALETAWVALGGLLGGPIGVGTVVFALLIGPAVEHGTRAAHSIGAVPVISSTMRPDNRWYSRPLPGVYRRLSG